MALAQFIHESGGLQFKEEWACGPSGPGCSGQYQSPGCDIAGHTYSGRGYIQLTWCANYKQCSSELGYGDLFVQNPEQVSANEDYAWATAFWFWGKNVHAAAQTGQFGKTTLAINGALECQGQNVVNSKDRYYNYVQTLSAFGLSSGMANESGCYN